MEFVPYNILNPVTDIKKPFLHKNGFFYFRLYINKYKYYIECSNFDINSGDTEYYILLSDKKLNKDYRQLNIDNYGRYKFKPKGEMLNFIKRECEERGNVNIKFISDNDDYSIFKIE